ncbi:MAG: hypothetical protein WAM97_05830, partial [Acidimicrobiales bacterium]
DLPREIGNIPSVLVVAHIAPVGSRSPTSGRWMFELEGIETGYRYLWISSATGTAICTKESSATEWYCGQTTLRFPQGNGWQLATGYYEPANAFYSLQGSLGHESPEVYDVYQPNQKGQFECLRTSSVVTDQPSSKPPPTLTWCIARSGILASFSAQPEVEHPGVALAPADGSFVSASGNVPASDFTLPAKPGPWPGPIPPHDG